MVKEREDCNYLYSKSWVLMEIHDKKVFFSDFLMGLLGCDFQFFFFFSFCFSNLLASWEGFDFDLATNHHFRQLLLIFFSPFIVKLKKKMIKVGFLLYLFLFLYFYFLKKYISKLNR